MDGLKLNRSVFGFGGAMVMVAAMLAVVVAYLVATYASTSVVVALLATAIVVLTAGTPYVYMRRRCAREACERERLRNAASTT
jgi:hypothetical protein